MAKTVLLEYLYIEQMKKLLIATKDSHAATATTKPIFIEKLTINIPF